MAAIRSVLTRKDHLSAAVGVVSLYWMMEGPVWRSMSVHWVHIIASSSVSMKIVDSGVNVLLATPSMLIKGPVQVRGTRKDTIVLHNNKFPLQILMNVPLTLVLVVKFAITPMVHLIASALMDTRCLMME